MIRIHVVAAAALVFDLNDVRALRALGITGVLVGTLPRAPQQNVFLGLPLQLSVYEACWAVANGFAQFVEGELYNDKLARYLEKPIDHSDLYAVTPDILRPPTGKEVERREHTHGDGFRDDSHSHGADYEATKMAFSGNVDMVSETKEEDENKEDDENKEEDEIEGEKDNGSGQNDAKSDIETPHGQIDANELDTTVNEIETMVHGVSLVDLEDFSAPAIEESDGRSINELDVQLEACALSLHQFLARQTLPEAFHTKYSAFSHLRHLGYYMMPGLRFGGVFVAYPGDPLQFHSHLIVKVLQKNENVNLLELVTSGRLATAVKKAWVLMGEITEENPESNSEIEVTSLKPNPTRAYSIEWTGFG